MTEPQQMNTHQTKVLSLTETSEGIEELSADPADFGHSEETEESEELTEESAMVQLDVFLHRLFTIGEWLPWKHVQFQVIGIRNGIVALQARSIKHLPPAKKNTGRRKSRCKTYKSKKRVITVGG